MSPPSPYKTTSLVFASNDNTAFSLLEILATLAIIACVTTLTLPAWHLLQEREARYGATELILKSLERARTAAVEAHRPTWVIFDHPPQKMSDRFCILQENEQGSFGLIAPWAYLPDHTHFLLSDTSIIKALPPQTVLGFLDNVFNESFSSKNTLVGSLEFNAQGTIIYRYDKGHPLQLALTTSFHNTSGTLAKTSADTILLGRLSGRAHKKSSR